MCLTWGLSGPTLVYELFSTHQPGASVPASLDGSLGWMLSNAARLTQRRFSTKLSPHGITPPQRGVLAALRASDGLSRSPPALRSELPGPTEADIVDRLENS